MPTYEVTLGVRIQVEADDEWDAAIEAKNQHPEAKVISVARAGRGGPKATSAMKPVRKSGGLTPEGRARLSAATKARHAAGRMPGGKNYKPKKAAAKKAAAKKRR